MKKEVKRLHENNFIKTALENNTYFLTSLKFQFYPQPPSSILWLHAQRLRFEKEAIEELEKLPSIFFWLLLMSLKHKKNSHARIQKSTYKYLDEPLFQRQKYPLLMRLCSFGYAQEEIFLKVVQVPQSLVYFSSNLQHPKLNNMHQHCKEL